ncbi:MAG: serine/threonine protein kinase, partial [Pirellulaceae bacterium]
NYTVQADFYATDKKGAETTDRLPDFGLIAQRYTLDLQGSQRLQIRSWTPRLELRFAKTIDFAWEAKTWYTMKFQSQNVDGGVTLRGKVWKRGEAEPEGWQIEATDTTPNIQGSPGLFGNSTDAQFYVDNVSVKSN